MNHDLSIIAARILDIWETAQRVKGAGVATEQELKVLAQTYDIELTTAGTSTLFEVKLSEEKAAFFLANGAAKRGNESVHRTAWAEGVQSVGNVPSEVFQSIECRILAHGHLISANALDQT